jgi:hypothetical protein
VFQTILLLPPSKPLEKPQDGCMFQSPETLRFVVHNCHDVRQELPPATVGMIVDVIADNGEACGLI